MPDRSLESQRNDWEAYLASHPYEHGVGGDLVRTMVAVLAELEIAKAKIAELEQKQQEKSR